MALYIVIFVPDRNEKMQENVCNSYIIPALFLYVYSYTLGAQRRALNYNTHGLLAYNPWAYYVGFKEA